MMQRIEPLGREEDGPTGVEWDAEAIREFPVQGRLESAFPETYEWAIDNPEAWALVERTDGRPRALDLRALVFGEVRKDTPTASDVHVDAPMGTGPRPRKRKKRKTTQGGFAFLSKRREKQRPFVASPTEEAIRRALVKAPEVLGRPSSESIEEALRLGNEKPVLAALDWDGFRRSLTAALEPLFLKEMVESGRRVQSDPNAVRKALSLKFNERSPRVIAWVKRYVAALVTHIIEQVREAIRGVILRAYTEGIAPRDAVPLIREALGEPALFPRWQQAVYNYLADLTEQGVEQERAEEMARAYRTRLIDARAFMIARTETVAAQTAGRTEVYQQALDEGWLDADTKKRWMAAPEGPCPICEALDGTEVGWDETWAGGVAAPPAHVNCRCTYVLVEAT